MMLGNSLTESYLANSRWRCSETSLCYYNSNYQAAAQSNHSIHSSHDHNSTLDTGRYSRPSTGPRKEAMLGDVTDHQAAETNKWMAMQRTTVGTTWTAYYQENEMGQLCQLQNSIPIKLYIKKCIWLALLIQPCRIVNPLNTELNPICQ